MEFSSLSEAGKTTCVINERSFYLKSMRQKDYQKLIAIYEAALKLITSEGLAHTSMSKIAKEAGVSASTIYVYFENKEDMLNKLYLMVKEESGEYVMRTVTDTMDVKELHINYLERMFHFMRDNPTRFSFQEQFYNSPNISEETKEEGLRRHGRVYEIFLKAVEEGFIKRLPLPVISAFTINPIFNLVGAEMRGELEVTEELLDQVTEMIWDAIKA